MAATLVLLPLAAPFILGAQSAPPPSFDVASVRQDKRHSWVRRPWTPNIDCAPIGQCGVSGSRFTEEFASLDDLIMKDGNRIVIGVVSVGGFLGMGNKLVAVSYDQLHLEADKDQTKITMPGASKDALNAMPTFTYGG